MSAICRIGIRGEVELARGSKNPLRTVAKYKLSSLPVSVTLTIVLIPWAYLAALGGGM